MMFLAALSAQTRARLLEGGAIVFVLLLLALGWHELKLHYIDVGVQQEKAVWVENTATAKATADAEEATRQTQFTQTLAASAAARKEEKDAYETKIADLEKRARAGGVSMRVPTTARVCNADAGAGAGIVAGPSDAQDTGLMPATVGDILHVAGGIAANMRDYNNLADAYDKLVDFCNAK